MKQSNACGIYKKGEKVRVVIWSNEKTGDSVLLKVYSDFSKKLTQKRLTFNGDSLVVFEKVMTHPESMIFEVTCKSETSSIGLVVNPEKFKIGLKPPKDFKGYWYDQKKMLKALPMKVKKDTIGDTINGYACFDTEINCVGPKSARGYFAKPQFAKPKSLPIVIYFHAAGVAGNWCRSEPGNALRYAKMGKGALCFDLNAHGMLNGQPEAYYQNLENGDLKNYTKFGLESRDDYYFRAMYLRLLRTIDFMTAQPEWDGKRILVIGESQGGGQALAAAGLDKRVTAVIATVPAICNLSAGFVGQKESWPYPVSSKIAIEKLKLTVPYFDAANLIKDSKATLVVEIGLIDKTCPSANVYSAINQSKGKKIILAVPYRGHHMTQPVFKTLWDNTVKKTKDDFLSVYLK